MKYLLIIITLLLAINVSAQLNVHQAEMRRMEANAKLRIAIKNAVVTSYIVNDFTYYFKGKLMVGFIYNPVENEYTKENLQKLVNLYESQLGINFRIKKGIDSYQYYTNKDKVIYTITVTNDVPDKELLTAKVYFISSGLQ